jgi:HPr kinase/phosphorylase
VSRDSDRPHLSDTRHATSIAIDAYGILIAGASGSGKSALALELIARGAALISDDLTVIERGGEGWPILTSPGRMQGVIEARGVGLLQVPQVPRAALRLVVDMDTVETARLPERREIVMAGTPVPLVHKVDSPHFPAAIWSLAKGGRMA